MRPKRAFTLIELLVALTVMATALAITFSVFYSITRAWQRGTTMADNLNRGEFLMDQLAVGLRSAFYPPAQTNHNDEGSDFGFTMESGGMGAHARAVISWVKTGPELLGPASRMEHGLHRVMIAVEFDREGRPALASRAWRPYTTLLDGFDPANEPPVFLANRIHGLQCRVSTNLLDDGWEWEEEWEGPATNTLPLAVELTLFLEPLEQGEAPVELKRTVAIPVAPFARQSGGRRNRP